jgi:hypothetical protein
VVEAGKGYVRVVVRSARRGLSEVVAVPEDGETRDMASPVATPDVGTGGQRPKEAGWYPSRTNPNDQTYWDGEEWIARRRWTGSGGWVTAGESPTFPEPELISANPYAQPSPAKATTTRTPFRRASAESATSLGLVLLLASGVLLMVGSTTTWIHASTSFGNFFHLSVSVNGLDSATSSLFSLNGYATIICGVVIVALAGASMAADDSSLRRLTLVAGLTSLGLAAYFVVRVAQKVSDANGHGSATVGAGLILLGIGGLLAGVISFARLVQNA